MTPSALLMAESAAQGEIEFTFFATARLIDVMLGVAIGLIGVWFVGRKSASSRLPHLISKTIRSQAQLFYVLFSKADILSSQEKNIEINKMQTNLNNLKTVYDTATGEIPVNKKALEYYWGVIYCVEQLGFLLEKSLEVQNRPVLSDDTLAKSLFIFETMANAAEHETIISKKKKPEIQELPSIQDALEELQKSLQVKTSRKSS